MNEDVTDLSNEAPTEHSAESIRYRESLVYDDIPYAGDVAVSSCIANDTAAVVVAMMTDGVGSSFLLSPMNALDLAALLVAAVPQLMELVALHEGAV